MSNEKISRLEAAQNLVAHWRKTDEDFVSAYMLSNPDDLFDVPVRILEVTNGTPATRTVQPFGFRETSEFPYWLSMAQVTPNEFEDIKSGEISLPDGWDLESMKLVQSEEEKLAENAPSIFAPLPNKKYDIIYADPPWSYVDKANAGKRGAGWKYQTLSQEDLKTLPVQSIASDDCALFLWVTMPKLNEVFDLISVWGFTYKTCAFNWVKKNKVADSLFWGMGRWTRASSELCLLATRGKPKRVSASVHSAVLSKIGKHSEKPAEVRDRIVQLMGDKPRIELFARQETEGWDAWGNQLSP